MVSLIPHGASARRLAAVAGLIGALSAGHSLAEPQPSLGPGADVASDAAAQPTPEPWPGPGGRPGHQAAVGLEVPPTPGQVKATAYEQILLSRAVRGEIGHWAAAAGPSGAGTGPVTEAPPEDPLPCFTGGPEGPLPEDRVQDATLMLMATYDTAGPMPGGVAAYFGTGTVIRSDEGLNRVLTAAHVASPEMIDASGVPVMLRSVYAFDGEGRLVAELSLSYAHTGRIQLGAITQELVQEDVAVLAPIRFPSEEMARSWQGRGVDIAPRQSESVLFFYGEGGASLISGGFSGAALYNPEGGVVGLITETVALPDTARRAPNTVMPEAVLNGDLSSMGMRDRQILESTAPAPSEGVYVDSVAAGPPISGRGLLSALGVDPDRIETVPALDTNALYSAGYPGRECRETWVRHEPRPDVAYLERPYRHVDLPTADPTIFTERPGYIRRMGPDGVISEPEKVGGLFFGAQNGWLNGGADAGPPVKDPFAPSDPDETPEVTR